jgi:hypothetical protein
MREFTQNNERAMQQFDKDGDGKLSDKEWAAARERVEQRMGQAAVVVADAGAKATVVVKVVASAANKTICVSGFKPGLLR